MLKRSLEIKTERLIMKPFHEDQTRMLALFKNAEIKETYMIPDYFTDQEYLSLFNKMKESSHSDQHFRYGIYLQEELIGWLNDVEIDQQRIELGYVIDPAYKNKGYATEALKAAIKELFRIGYTVVRTGLFEENVASRRVMEKCGMQLIDFSEIIEYKGKNHRCIYLEIKK